MAAGVPKAIAGASDSLACLLIISADIRYILAADIMVLLVTANIQGR